MQNAKPDIYAVFNEAIAREAGEKRRRFVEEACGNNAVVKERVEALLRAHSEAGRFMGGKSSANAANTATINVPAAAVTVAPGTQIGPYKLREKIGEGGFGVVYVAEQSEPVRRKVALKIIKPGMDSHDVIARFEAERQALAMMDHPNVAKVLDAGTTESGRPYFVMELVDGIPITEFCDQRKLSVPERLELFVDVCRAVQHAHQKGVIHRDLKPSNVMITLHDEKPAVKVIDFGVSKALSTKLTEKTVYTAYGQMVGTPLYMSPEQAQLSGVDVDTRSDVYSLGVLLYELLTGTTSFEKETLQKSGFDEMRRMIREVDPPRPSARVSTLNVQALSTVSGCRRIAPRKLGQSLRGELDWIVMKALEKDRNRRYESTGALAADVERYLNDEPVEARRPSAIYKFRKLAHRKKGLLTAVTVISLLVLSFAGSVGWFMRDQAARQMVVEQTARQALVQCDRHVEERNWPAALAEARRAKAALSGETDSGLRARIARRLSELELVARLEQVRAEARSRVAGQDFDYAGANREYTKVFREYGIDPTQPESTHYSSAIRPQIAAALDDWAAVRKTSGQEDGTRWKQLLEAAQAIDSDPRRNQFRQAWADDNSTALRQLAESAAVGHWSPTTSTLLARMLEAREEAERAFTLLRAAHRSHPDDFWVNFELGRTADMLGKP